MKKSKKAHHKKKYSKKELKSMAEDIKELKFKIKNKNQEIFKLSGNNPGDDFSELDGKAEDE